MSSAIPEMETIKARLRSTWMDGDYGQLARYNAGWAEEFVSRLPVDSGTRVLDVACGTGNMSVAAARRGAIVTGVDIATNLLEQARARASAEGLEIRFEEGDAEQLPCDDASFDLVVSMFGAMFAPRPEKTAAELIRVCRSGGRVAMANWTPEGFIGDIFKLTASYAPPPPGIPSPLLWGSEDVVRERLRDGISDLKLERRVFVTSFPFGEAEVVNFFRTYFGPIKRAFDALDEGKQAELQRDLEKLWREHNRATDGTTQADAEYLEVIALRS